MAKRSSRKNMRKSRRASRMANRRASRRNRRTMMMGGSAPVNNASMAPMSAQSLAQGEDYLSIHKGQYGGSSCGAPMMRGGMRRRRGMMYRRNTMKGGSSCGAPIMRGGAAVSLAASAPVGYTGMLDDSLRGAARIAPLDQSIGAIQGMRDQAGGARRRKARKGAVAAARRLTKRMRASLLKAMRRLRKVSRKVTRKMRGGAALHPADYSSPGMLLGPADQAKALMGMNPEWKLASDPGAFAPRS